MSARGRWVLALGVACVMLMTTGCATPVETVPLPPTAGEVDQRDAGVALLARLLEQESRVDGILAIKSLDDETEALVREIAESARSARERLAPALAASSPNEAGAASSDLVERTRLPAVETGARTRIERRTTSDLLFASGDVSRTRLLLTQFSATEYAEALASELASRFDAEDERAIRREFEAIAATFGGYRQRAERLLRPVDET